MRKPVYKIDRPILKRPYWLLILVVALIVSSALGFTYYRNSRGLDQQEKQKSQDEAQTDSSKKNVTSSIKTIKSSDAPSSNLKQDVPQSQESISIVSFSEIDNVVKSIVRISSGDGLCVFTYTPGDDKPVIDSVQSSKSSCISELSANQFSRIGDYKLNVTAYINGKRTEANQNVTIN